MGGMVALDAALEAPERIAGLVLLAPAVSGDPEPDEEAFDAASEGLGTRSMRPGRPATRSSATGWRSGSGSTGRPGRRDA